MSQQYSLRGSGRLESIRQVAIGNDPQSYDIGLLDGRLVDIHPSEVPGAPEWLVLPAFVNLHAHADRAYTAPLRRPTSLADAIELSAAARAGFTVESVAERAERFFRRSIRHGVLKIRTHTDVDPIVGARSLRGVLRAVEAVGPPLAVDIVAFSTAKNDLADAASRDRVREAIAMGADLIGAVPAFSRDPQAALNAVLDLAAELDRPADLHLDEHLELDRMLAGKLADRIVDRGLEGRVTLSHACALSSAPDESATSVIDALLRADITVVALPETNLFLQDRGGRSPRRRGVAPLKELLAAGVRVRLGTDNVRDWFYPFGDGDPLDTLFVASLATQIDDARSLLAAVCDGQSSIGEGDPADLVLVPAASLDDALSRRPPGRIVLARGCAVT